MSFPVLGVLLALLLAFKQEGILSRSDVSSLCPSPGHMVTKVGVELLSAVGLSELKVASRASQVGL